MSQSAKRTQPQEPSRRGWAATIGRDAIPLTETAARKAGFPNLTMVTRWREIVGAEVAEIAQPVRCRQGPDGMVLTVRCEPGTSVFLQHQTRTLTDHLNAVFGSGTISRIRVIPGTSVPQRTPSPHPGGRFWSPPAPDEQKRLTNALNRLKNLRNRLPRARTR